MRTYLFLGIAAMISLGLVGSARAGALGNPMDMASSRHFFVSIEYDGISRVIDEAGTSGGSGEEYLMKSGRFLAKGGYGLLNFLDLFVRLGASNLEIGRFEGDVKFSYGGGAKLNLFHLRPIRAKGYLIGQMLNYTSEGTVSEWQSPYVQVQFLDEYTWREYQWGAVFATQVRTVLPYVGFEKTTIGGKIKRRHQVADDVATPLPGYESSGDDFADDKQSIRPVFGFDVRLPGRYTLSLEAQGVSKNEFSFIFGISQTAPISRQIKKLNRR